MNTNQSSPKIHALYGDPVEHSLSPAMFNAAFKHLGLNREYRAFSVTPDRLEEAVNSAVALGFGGFNVTMPLKEQVIPFLDKLEGQAKEAGAVNTVALRASTLVGYNTDGEGTIQALQASHFEPSHRSILVLGAGGAARGIVNALSTTGSEIVIINRTLERARNIVHNYLEKGNVSIANPDKTSLLKVIANVDLILNATPLSIASLLGTLGVSMNSIPAGVVTFDVGYLNQLESRGEKRGSSSISPFELLFQQALLSYRIWMNAIPPDETMRRALIERIGYDWRKQTI